MDKKTLYSDSTGSEYFEEVRNLTFPQYLLPRIKEFSENGNGDWLIDGLTGRRRSYADLEGLTRKIGSAFYKRGLRKGDTVLYMTYDIFHIHALMLGVWRANGIIRASYVDEDEETLLERVVDSHVSWIVCEPDTSNMCLTVASKVSWKVEVIVVGESTEGCISIDDIFNDDGSELPQQEITGKDVSLILTTSGTTGRSKGAAHTHTDLLTGMTALRRIMPKSQLRLFVSRATHIAACTFPLAFLCIGETSILMSRITTKDLCQVISTYRPQMIFAFPAFLLRLVNDPEARKYDLSSLEIAYSGGALVTSEVEKAVLTLPSVKFVMQSYGLTEVFPVTSVYDISTPIDEYLGSPSCSVGKLTPGVAMQVRHIDTNEVLGPNQHGEICLKSGSMFKFYVNNPEATRDAFVNGWFRTGDIGYYDENGFIFLVDRVKEVFKYYNNHISPTEVEKVISKHQSVDEVYVVGVVDPEGGDRIPRAFVKLKPKIEASLVTTEEIRQFANERLPNYKHLRGGVYFLSNFPLGKTGKVSRKLLGEIDVMSLDS